jgi:predicted enzyme related to lactoylglutathione lyase
MSDCKGRFLWYELMTTDVDAARTFYSEVIGWSTSQWPEAETPYTMWMNGETAIGGLMLLPEEAKAMGAPPHWMAYIGVDDVDATVKQATKLGAALLNGPFDVPKVGRIAILRDPQGAAFSIYTPVETCGGNEPQRKVGEVSWNELNTRGSDDAWTFYSALFGWKVVQEMPLPPEMGGGMYRIYGSGQLAYGGITNGMPDVPPSWMYYIRVSDIDATVARATALGARLLNGPMEVPDGDRVAQLMDPQGAAFALHWMKNPR